MVTDEFFEKSRQIADNFLQTVVLIDDQAYSNGIGDVQHDLDAAAVTRNFAQKRKICSIYKPEREDELENLTRTANKADIVVLDWKIHLETDAGAEVDEEEIVEEEDPRGEYTLQIIRDILSYPEPGVSGLKLFVVYTGETDLAGIAQKIYSRLATIPNTELQQFSVISTNFKVVVIGKPTLMVNHLPEIQVRVIDYPDLPDFILNEFAKMTSGLISDFVLNALCILRSNTSRLLQIFSSKLDPAFLAHCALLPNHEDAQEQLIEILAQSVSALLNYNKAGETLSINRIENWIDSQSLPTKIINFGGNINYNIDSIFLKEWIRDTFFQAVSTKVQEAHADLSNALIDKIKSKERSLHNTATQYFTQAENFLQKDIDFSILTHQKSNLRHPAFHPRLTLGTIIRQATDTEPKYFVCIQQKCDSVRIEEARQFLFLPLLIETGDKKFHFIIEENDIFYRLRVDSSTFSIKTILFEPNNGVIKAEFDANTNKYVFQSTSEGIFVWLSDLKDAHAQRLSNQYAAQLSRVGLDESEWLRRWAGN